MRVTKDMIHPELRLPKKLIHLLSTPNRTEEMIRNQKASSVLRIMKYLKPAGIKVEEKYISRPDDSQMKLYIVTRKNSNSNKRPGILSIHGGGYSGGDPLQDIIQAKVILGLVDGVFITPDYRRSVEAPYPAAVNDCYTALKWMKDHTVQLGIRSDQLIVIGGSAGGGLTAATTLMAREKGEVNIAFQMPLYPMIDDRPTPSSIDNNAPIYDGITNQSNWKIYLGDLYGTDHIPATAAPARADDFTGLPPTISMAGSIDPFHDETVTYVDNLRRAGIPVEFREFIGAWHGFEGIAFWTKIAKEANKWRNEKFVEYLSKYTAPQPDTGF
ncbi:acetyl esterase/lipase [Paenibacillus cellulosilyticus]|uniref:Acetyl esterase/lipase n=1 Tax=Paenibacillus cellulosilyticus TaxID=375489 RepID=A0A2V2Z1S0_9BACL|nr:alpha/beta hydrolase [Paenibacillus cellulosilyticus]PWW08792.1 acetyl esterase/lipase [Paenibacillus cellulosilyticus]QKS48344.1 alpha/beta hydrolase [Paenibacillus cellulosilyticus]